jgi:hypothetical protein
MPLTSRATAVVVALGAALMPALAPGKTSGDPLPELTLDELKRSYLACERASMTRVLRFAEAAQCSIVYEALKVRAFDGDFEKLRAWWLSARGAQ